MGSNECSSRVAEKGLQEFRGKLVSSYWNIVEGFMEEVASELNHEG